MLTYYEIKGIMEKVTLLTGHVKFMQDIVLNLVQYSEEIEHINKELLNEQNEISCKLRSVEVLEDFLKKHIFNNNQEALTGVDINTPEPTILDKVK